MDVERQPEEQSYFFVSFSRKFFLFRCSVLRFLLSYMLDIRRGEKVNNKKRLCFFAYSTETIRS